LILSCWKMNCEWDDEKNCPHPNRWSQFFENQTAETEISVFEFWGEFGFQKTNIQHFFCFRTPLFKSSCSAVIYDFHVNKVTIRSAASQWQLRFLFSVGIIIIGQSWQCSLGDLLFSAPYVIFIVLVVAAWYSLHLWYDRRDILFIRQLFSVRYWCGIWFCEWWVGSSVWWYHLAKELINLRIIGCNQYR